MSDNIKFAEERQQRILDLLHTNTRINVKDIAASLSVTEATIRRDLKLLEQQGKLYRTHGGAILKEQPIPWQITTLESRQKLSAKEKQRIADYVAKIVKDNDSIMLDGGSTNLAIALTLARTKKNLQIITNSQRIGYTIANDTNGNKVLTTGGELVYRSQNSVGILAEENIRRYQVDLAFIGATAIFPQNGCYSANPQESAIKSLMIRQAKNAYIVCDSSKIGTYAFSKFTDFSDITAIITDSKISSADKAIFKEKDVTLILV
jgi:DeoR/GlpR family transcriptional regulator of sugar metabolism